MEYIRDLKTRAPLVLIGVSLLSLIGVIVLGGCTEEAEQQELRSSDNQIVPYENRWGIYSLDLSTEKIELIYSSEYALRGLRLNNAGDTFVFSQRKGTEVIDSTEVIMRVDISGENLTALTDDEFMDTCPAWSSDDNKIYFSTVRGGDLDIYSMNADGTEQSLVYDSGTHDADIHSVGNKLVFTAGSSIWMINDDGSSAVKLTAPPRAGEWGKAVLPFGDYDPRFSPDGSKIVFERLEDDASVHGNYNLYIIGSDGSGETRLTDSGYAQGLASFSHSGDRIVYIVSAIGNEGKYDIYMMNSDGSDNRNIMPSFVPREFLAHVAIFSADGSKIFFIGEWWNVTEGHVP